MAKFGVLVDCRDLAEGSNKLCAFCPADRRNGVTEALVSPLKPE